MIIKHESWNENGNDCTITHNVQLCGSDGSYKIYHHKDYSSGSWGSEIESYDTLKTKSTDEEKAIREFDKYVLKKKGE